MEPGQSGPFRLAGNTLHKRRSFLALRIIVWLKCSIWSYGSVEPSYIANDDITKLRGGGGGGGGARNLKYVGLGVRTTYPLVPGRRKKKPNAGRRLPRLGDAWAKTKRAYPRSGQAHIRGPVLNGVCLCWPLFIPDGTRH